MVIVGAGLAGFLLIASGLSRAERDRARAGAPDGADRSREAIAASILFQIARLGGLNPSQSVRLIREVGNAFAPYTTNIDLGSWAAEFARRSSRAESTALLESAVRTAVASGSTVPLVQYDALLELSFALGFQTDALARLRARYRFEYIDYAKHARPASADRAGAATFCRRKPVVDSAALLSELGLEPPVTRQRVISAYRKQAAAWHPDRFFGAPAGEQQLAAERFIRLTESYEQLMRLCEDD